jgi:anti-sigma B factor antagonist
MEIGSNLIDDVLIVSLFGELHVEQTHLLEIKFEDFIQRSQKFIVNCADLEYIDSQGLGSLIKIAIQIRNKDGELVLCSPVGKVKKVFDLTRFDRYIKVFADCDQASRFFRE